MVQGREKSLKLNMILNAIKGIMSIVFPLISFPYVSKILGVENIGKYNFANSIINYVVLFAGLGISTYAIREGARIRNNMGELRTFAGEMFSINVISTIVAYIGLFILLIIVPKFHEYTSILLILSLQVVFKTIGIEWIYSIYEDYAYITIRSIIFQALSLVLLFLLVKTQNDVNRYAAITVLSSVGSNILNYIHARKYCKVSLTIKINWKKHIKPILVLFAMSLTVTLYVSSDTTMLGLLCNDYTVGIYSVSTKIYSIVKTVLSSVLVVSIPRLSSLIGESKGDEFNEVASDIYRTLLTLVLPAITGLIVLRKQIILILADNTYIRAESSLMLLSIALLFCLGAWFWGQCILVPLKKENIVFKATIVSAIVNVVLNLVLIKTWKENAAAFTTILAEAISLFWCSYFAHRYTKLTKIVSTTIKSLIGCLVIVGVAVLGSMIISSDIAYICFTVGFSVLLYGATEVFLKNEAIWSILRSLKKYSRDN